MISVIVSSYNAANFNNLARSIEHTIGDVLFEIIKVENHGEFGLCAAYNLGAKQARYPILCFVHEDVIFKTENWGTKVRHHFESIPNLGLLGVAGGSYKSFVPSGWATKAYPENFIHAQIIQSKKDKTERETFVCGMTDKVFAETVTVDGVCFFTLKAIVTESPFDEETFRGFHCYDLDFSLAVGLHRKVVVCFDILLEHFSKGNFDYKWLGETIKFQRKWASILPRSAGHPLSQDAISYIEATEFYNYVRMVLYNNGSLKTVTDIYFADRFKTLVGVKRWMLIPVFIFAWIIPRFVAGRVVTFFRTKKING
jgi:glycosyltransferase involved in cell wall biosynthesis